MNETLNNISPGSLVEVLRIKGTGVLSKRLVEMGIVKGSVLRVQRTSLWNGPIEVKLKNCRISLRKSEAAHVEVRNLESKRERDMWSFEGSSK